MLTLEVEFLSGVCYAAAERNSNRADWPLQPDRLFSALVASWAARGELVAERRALEWLESQPPPRLIAGDVDERMSVDFYVPTNDARSGRDGNLAVVPRARSRQPRRFPAVRPHDPILHIVWDADPDEGTMDALASIAHDVVYAGHSASLVRAHFTRNLQTSSATIAARLVPYAGRLAELEYAFQRGARPSKGALVSAQPSPHHTASNNLFGPDWIVLPSAGGFVPDARAFALIAKRMRDALMSSFGLRNESVPAWISGHGQDGSPLRGAHLAIVPMIDVGHTYAASSLMGLALVPPSGIEGADRILIKALLALRVPGSDAPQMRLHVGSGSWHLAFTDDDTRPSLQPKRWLSHDASSQTRRWATATPIVLDRHLKSRCADERQREIEALIASAVQNVGLPAPSRVVADKHSAVHGAISASPSTGEPGWMRWGLPPSLESRRLTHAVIEFAEPIIGPLLVGAGRFVGLGLCWPLGDDRRDG